MVAYPLPTERLYLRPFAENDSAAVFAYYSLPEVARYVYWNARDEQQSREVLSAKTQQTSLIEVGDILSLAVCLKQTGQLIGEVTLRWRSQEHRQGEIGFVFNPEFAGHGYASEAAKAMLELGFDEFKLHRIYGRCDTRNIASYKLMERIGMRRETHFIENELFKGE